MYWLVFNYSTRTSYHFAMYVYTYTVTKLQPKLGQKINMLEGDKCINDYLNSKNDMHVECAMKFYGNKVS